jgi:hypothetical protein
MTAYMRTGYPSPDPDADVTMLLGITLGYLRPTTWWGAMGMTCISYEKDEVHSASKSHFDAQSAGARPVFG